jgi:hypothetical protein
MEFIQNKIGHKACNREWNREWNRERMTDKIISLAQHANSALHRNPEQMLLEALKEVREGAWTNNHKMLILTVDEENDSYRLNWMQTGMRMSQCIAMCEVGKAKFMTEMGYIKPRDEA